MVLVVADVEVALGVECEVFGAQEGGVLLGAAVAGVSSEAEAGVRERGRVVEGLGVMSGVASGEGVDDAGASVYAADGVCPLAGEEDVAGVVYGDAAGGVELGLDGGSAVTAASDFAGSGDGSDDACTVVDAAGGVVPEAGEVEVSMSISAEVVGAVDPRVPCGAAVAGVPGHAVAREGVEDAVGVDAPDAVAVVIVDDDVAVDLPDDAHGPAALSFPGGDAFSDRRTRNRRDVTEREVSETVV